MIGNQIQKHCMYKGFAEKKKTVQFNQRIELKKKEIIEVSKKKKVFDKL